MFIRLGYSTELNLYRYIFEYGQQLTNMKSKNKYMIWSEYNLENVRDR